MYCQTKLTGCCGRSYCDCICVLWEQCELGQVRKQHLDNLFQIHQGLTQLNWNNSVSRIIYQRRDLESR